MQPPAHRGDSVRPRPLPPKRKKPREKLMIKHEPVKELRSMPSSPRPKKKKDEMWVMVNGRSRKLG